MSMITNNTEALTEALALAINAPTEQLKDELIEIADGIAQQLTAEEIEACKAAAKTRAGLIHPSQVTHIRNTKLKPLKNFKWN